MQRVGGWGVGGGRGGGGEGGQKKGHEKWEGRRLGRGEELYCACALPAVTEC